MSSALDYACPRETCFASPNGPGPKSAGDLGAQGVALGHDGAPDDRRGRLLAVECAGDPAAHGLDAAVHHPHLAAFGKLERERPAITRELYAIARAAHLAALVAMEEHLHFVLAAHLERVLDHDAPRGFVQLDAAAMDDGIRKRRVAVVPAL